MSTLRIYSTEDLQKWVDKLDKLDKLGDDISRGSADMIHMLIKREEELMQQRTTLTQRISELESERYRLREAATLLLALKDYKEANGKDHYYQMEKSEKWEALRLALTTNSKGE